VYYRKQSSDDHEGIPQISLRNSCRFWRARILERDRFHSGHCAVDPSKNSLCQQSCLSRRGMCSRRQRAEYRQSQSCALVWAERGWA